ncbi:MAG: hypothetical protein PHT51_00060 [Patescibacteria group bacterium]|nr:hypothetical protein [Patescibacteria group bacterium]MDD4610628.1 hypothetical protein [Patescibacteria group bacterium]
MKEQNLYSKEEATEVSDRMRELTETGEAGNYPTAEKMVNGERAIAGINKAIEDARKNRFIDNETANLISAALELKGDEALFANRVISRGSDPASFELALKGEISKPTMRAHRSGPGSLTDEERDPWLVLAHASIDEHSAADLPPTAKFKQFHEALKWLESASDEEKKAAAEEEFQKIINLPFEEGEIRGVKMRIYNSDRGFASAYWSGEGYAAVKEGNLTFVGSKEKTLQEIGVKVDKELSPTFGIIFEKK